MDAYFRRIQPTLEHLLSISNDAESFAINSFINYLRSAKKFYYVVLIMEESPISDEDNILFIPTVIGKENVFNKKTILIIPLLEILSSYPTFLIKGTEYYLKAVRSSEKLVVPNRETVYRKIMEYEKEQNVSY